MLHTLDLEEFIHRILAALVEHLRVCGERIGLHSTGPDGQVCIDGFLAKLHALSSNFRGTVREPDLHTQLLQALFGFCPRGWMCLGDEAIPFLHEREMRLGCIAIGTLDHLLHELDQLAHDLHARWTAADDHKGQGAAFLYRMLEEINRTIPDAVSILDGLEGETVLLSSWNTEKISSRSQRQQQRIVLQRSGCSDNLLLAKINTPHIALPERKFRAAQHSANRLDNGMPIQSP